MAQSTEPMGLFLDDILSNSFLSSASSCDIMILDVVRVSELTAVSALSPIGSSLSESDVLVKYLFQNSMDSNLP